MQEVVLPEVPQMRVTHGRIGRDPAFGKGEIANAAESVHSSKSRDRIGRGAGIVLQETYQELAARVQQSHRSRRLIEPTAEARRPDRCIWLPSDQRIARGLYGQRKRPLAVPRTGAPSKLLGECSNLLVDRYSLRSALHRDWHIALIENFDLLNLTFQVVLEILIEIYGRPCGLFPHEKVELLRRHTT